MPAMQREENLRLSAEVPRQTEALRKANVPAMASSAAKSKFLSSAAHELRAPLQGLLGCQLRIARSRILDSPMPTRSRNRRTYP